MKGSKHRGNTIFLICYIVFKSLTVQDKLSEFRPAGTLLSVFEMFLVKLPEMQSKGDRIML